MSGIYAIDIKNLNKVYSNGVSAINNLSLQIKNGSFFGLLGLNGAGKSTLIGIITSLVKKTSGNVKICGIDIDDDFLKAKSYIGIMPQDFNFNINEDPITMLVKQAGFYGIPRKYALEKALYYIKILDLYNKRKSLIRFLSGGMRRRLMMARALISDPSILILDEPTAGADIEIRRFIWDFLKKLNYEKNITIILTTHYLDEVEYLCDSVGIIKNGTITRLSTINDILSKIDIRSFIITFDKKINDLNIENYSYKIIDDYNLEIDIKKNDNIFNVISYFKNLKIIDIKNRLNNLENIFRKEVK